MNTQDTSSNETTRREFIKTTGKLAAASALASVALPNVHAAGNDVIQLALVGCGGRGVSRMFELLDELGVLDEDRYDTAVFDVLGDALVSGRDPRHHPGTLHVLRPRKRLSRYRPRRRRYPRAGRKVSAHLR